MPLCHSSVLDEEIANGIVTMDLILMDKSKLIGEINTKSNCQTEWPCHFIVHNSNYISQRKFQSRRGGVGKNARYSQRKNNSDEGAKR